MNVVTWRVTGTG